MSAAHLRALEAEVNYHRWYLEASSPKRDIWDGSPGAIVADHALVRRRTRIKVAVQ